jgi:hypothetical protein
MTQYLLTMYQPTGGQPPDNIVAIMADVAAIRTDMQSSGVWLFGNGLHGPETATVVRDELVTDGPFVEAKEHIGGITIIEETDLDAALRWAKRMSHATTLPIEVRPFRG